MYNLKFIINKFFYIQNDIFQLTFLYISLKNKYLSSSFLYVYINNKFSKIKYSIK